MMSRLVRLIPVLVVVLGVLMPATAQAQTELQIGPRLGLPFGDLEDAGAELYVGADFRIETASVPVVFNPSFDLYFVDDPPRQDRSAFTLDLNVLYEFDVDSDVFIPYAGGGLGITRLTVDDDDDRFDNTTTEPGVNIVGGGRFTLDAVDPFAELNVTIGDDIDRIGLTGGVLFSL